MVEGGRFRGQDSPFGFTTCNLHVRQRADSRRVLWQSFSRGEEWYVELARAAEKPCTEKRPLRTEEEIVKNDFVKIDKLSYLLRGTGRMFLSRKGRGEGGGGTIIIKYSPVSVRKEGKE